MTRSTVDHWPVVAPPGRARRERLLNVPRVFGDIAVVTAVSHIEAVVTATQREIVVDMRVIDVFVRSGGRWQVLASQGNPDRQLKAGSRATRRIVGDRHATHPQRESHESRTE
jgi:hypothetical protein